jgi:hypothetical protein
VSSRPFPDVTQPAARARCRLFVEAALFEDVDTGAGTDIAHRFEFEPEASEPPALALLPLVLAAIVHTGAGRRAHRTLQRGPGGRSKGAARKAPLHGLGPGDRVQYPRASIQTIATKLVPQMATAVSIHSIRP